MHLVIGGDFSAPLPGAIDQFDQSIQFLDGGIAVFHFAGGDLVSMEGDVVPAFFPRQGIGFFEKCRSAQGSVEIGEYRRDVDRQPRHRRKALCPRLARWGENFYVILLNQYKSS